MIYEKAIDVVRAGSRTAPFSNVVPTGKSRQARGTRCVKIGVSLPSSQLQAVDAIATTSGRSRSATISKLLVGGLAAGR